MGKRDKRVDEFIKKAQPFARPILEHLRELVHDTVPDVVETMKWSMPSLEYKGMFVGMSAHKNYMYFLFWKGSLVNDPKRWLDINKGEGKEGMGGFGKITRLEDLPPDEVIRDLLKQAMKLNDDGITIPKAPKKDPGDLVVPDVLLKALRGNKQAAKNFESFSYSKRKDYAEWIASAKTDKTRESRLATAVEWIAEGRSRNWKYEKK